MKKGNRVKRKEKIEMGNRKKKEEREEESAEEEG
jgi:hypothetical protein